jgi:hypothetical protein
MAPYSAGSHRFTMLIRTVHHQAGTGGTLICKCLATQPDVCLISEINPGTKTRVRYAPLDPVSQFIAQYPALSGELRWRYFREQIEMLIQTCEAHKKHLIIRDHSHSDYLRTTPTEGSTLLSQLSGYEIRSIVTIRDPVDSYLSTLTRKNWLEAIDNDFELYCGRLLKFVQELPGRPVFRYEDFCLAPLRKVSEMCSSLEIEFRERFMNRFYRIRLTGDNGRISDSIKPRPRRQVDDDLVKAASESGSYAAFCERFGYSRIS